MACSTGFGTDSESEALASWQVCDVTRRPFQMD